LVVVFGALAVEVFVLDETAAFLVRAGLRAPAALVAFAAFGGVAVVIATGAPSAAAAAGSTPEAVATATLTPTAAA
jgi:hypothetical protein